jgi:hypothetical protein
LLLNLLERRGTRVDCEGDTHLLGKLTSILVGIGDDDEARTGVASDCGGHDADGAGSGNQDIFAEHGKRERGVDGVAEGVEDRGDLVRHAVAVDPDVRHREDNVFGERAVAVDADSEGVGAEMAAAGETVAATSADDMAFAADELTDGDVGYVRAGGDDLADELVADGEPVLDGGAGPGVPVVDVKVGAADAGGEYADFDVVDAHLGLGNILEPQAALFAALH